MRLPDAVIVGAPRSGTTSLYVALKEHPQVYAAHGKELHFFDDNWERGVPWYGTHFEGAPRGAVAIEATPMYLSSQVAMERLARTVPDATVVAILRDPVERLHSHYYYRRARGLDGGTLKEAIDRELSGDPRAFPYLRVGRYADQLEFVQTLPLERPVLVLWHDDLRQRPDIVSRHLARALSVNPSDLQVGGRRVNAADQFRSVRIRRWSRRLPSWAAAGVSRLNRREVSYPPLSDALRRTALEYFRSDVVRLEKIASRDLASWRENPGGISAILGSVDDPSERP